MAGSGPPTEGLRRVPMRHVAVKVLVATDLEQHNLAVVRHAPIGLEAANGRFQILDIRRPRVTEKSVSGRDHHRPAAATVVRWRWTPGGAVSDMRLWRHLLLL